MSPVDLPRVGARVQLRRLNPVDLGAFQAYRRDPELARFQGWRQESDEQALAFLQAMASAPFCEPGEWMQLGIAPLEGKQLLGDIGLHRALPPRRTVELGYTLARDWQGRGLATEAVALAIGLVWDGTQAVDIEACIDSRNDASERLLQRLNFRRVQVVETVFRGEPCTEHVYRLARADCSGAPV